MENSDADVKGKSDFREFQPSAGDSAGDFVLSYCDPEEQEQEQEVKEKENRNFSINIISKEGKERPYKELAFLRSSEFLEEQEKIINYAKFCADVATREGEDNFQKSAKNGGHPLIVRKFRELFPETEMK
ncbi:hypothetical protein KKC83_04975 [Patescibacteria group bacterium]|nr:hypothetical protein [Candidatus Falkowbacteria bacterium]MBU3906241.1 hypothetical protein [Patescibacteria group bacterium]MCG2697873.1 hypothetical protein [Candidatus Parcubacteria bacterium]MBU4015693.1 hypothetical protein [Patescibacteria group bacterium]MBU4026870.1 hypothetical protein [Patescibacteria group bacterium]